MSSIHIGIFGSGNIAQKAYLPLLTSWPNLHIKGVYSRTTSSLKRTSDRWPEIQTFTSQEALCDEGITAAFVLTPAESHFEICKLLLKKSIHVFVEKPPTISSKYTLQLAELADEQKRIFMVGFNRRYAPLVGKAKALINSSDIRMFVIEKHRPMVHPRGHEETYFEDLIHQIDLLRYFCGELQPVYTTVHSRKDVFLSAVSCLRTESGGLALLLASRETGRWQESLSIHGANINIRLKMFEKLWITQEDVESVYENGKGGSWRSHLVERGFLAELKHFLDCIENNQTPMTNGFDATKSQMLLETLVELGRK
jgi:virulence factor